MSPHRFTLFFLVILFLSCGSTKNQIINPLYYDTGPCKGFCPEFNVQIQKDTLRFEGFRNTLKTGPHTILLSEGQIKIIRDHLTKVTWSTINENYHETIYDLPQKKIRYLGKEVSFKTHIREHQNVYKLVVYIQQILIINGMIN